MSNKKDVPQFSLLPKILNGGIAGIIGVSVVFPLDLVKTRLQNQPVGPKGEKEYKNMLDCFRKTIATEGFLGMYKGSAINIILITPEKAIKLTGNDFFRHKLTLPDGSLPAWRQMIAGGSAGACQIIITTPMELLKIRMQDSGRLASEAKKAGKTFVPPTTMGLITSMLKERGIFGLYRGLGATAARDIFFSMNYFPLFATLNEQGVRKPDGSIPFWWSFVSGISAGATCAWSSTPLDVMKTRLQAGARSYSGPADVVSTIMKEEGVTAFFKGGLCRVIVIAPLFGIAQSVYYLGIGEYICGY